MGICQSSQASSSAKNEQKQTEKKEATEIKVLMLGASQVGKTQLVNAVVTQTFREEYDGTIEDNSRKEFIDEKVVLNIYDMGGELEDQFIEKKNRNISESAGFVLVYSITDEKSFEAIKTIYSSLPSKDEIKPRVVLVGNKCDMSQDRKVTPEQGQALANAWNCPFFESSAKSKIHHEDIFVSLVRQLKSSNKTN
eukprot:TRINITY_DN1735_c0_g1_i1.p1 TRINITY_DN1735_c0_g1~~TRINITY_DN1735_c0_g1_i1.p1  ORF type:complete len:195 (-),score=66.51 TRINITY_DN1735_c0_g1_i1:483-1067(-)